MPLVTNPAHAAAVLAAASARPDCDARPVIVSDTVCGTRDYKFVAVYDVPPDGFARMRENSVWCASEYYVIRLIEVQYSVAGWCALYGVDAEGNVTLWED